EKTAQSLLDSFKVLQNSVQFSLMYESPTNTTTPKTKTQIATLLQNVSEISQKRGLDIVSIKIESPSPSESALMANCYAEAYADYSLNFNKSHLTKNRDFLEKQVTEKYNDLMKSENKLTEFLTSENIVELDAQSNSLINAVSNFDVQHNTAVIETQTTNRAAIDMKKELDKYDPKASDFIEGKATDA